jgi:hypothetical protein
MAAIRMAWPATAVSGDIGPAELERLPTHSRGIDAAFCE